MSTNNDALIEHKDILGKLLKQGDCVAYPDRNQLVIGVIKKLTPKMLNVVAAGSRGKGVYKYPVDLLLLEGPEVTVYLLKKSAKLCR